MSLDTLHYVSMELIVTIAAIVMLGLEASGGVKDRRQIAWFGAGACVAAALVGLRNLSAPPGPMFGGSYVIDTASVYFKELMLSITFLALLISTSYVEAEIRRSGEYYTLFMFVCLGMLFLASANDLITIYLALEMTSMPMYVLSASKKFNKKSAEAGLKYLILGAFASAFYLFGASLTMGTLGTIYVTEFPLRVLALPQAPQALYVGLLCLIGAFAFKIAAAPFHMWAPDVYEGAPTTTTAFLSTGPKVAGMAVLMRVLLTGFDVVRPDMFVKNDWVLIVSVLSLLSMTVGNLVAMHQTNIKRMLAFSGIAHMGYMLLGIAAASTKGTGAVMFYLWLYTLASLGSWAVIVAFTLATGSEEIKDMAGLSRRSPYMAFVVMLAFLSLAGLPPMSGFVGKFYLFTAAWSSGLSWLVLAAVINSVASLFYYMGVLKVIYWQAPVNDEPISVPFGAQVAMAVGVFAAVVLGLFPPMSQWAFAVAKTFIPG